MRASGVLGVEVGCGSTDSPDVTPRRPSRAAAGWYDCLMMNVYLWLLVAIIIAAVVLVVAGTIAADESDARESTDPVDRSPRAVLARLVADARAGARSLVGPGRDRESRQDVRDHHRDEPTSSVAEFFEATRTEQRAYLDADEIQGIIQQLRPGSDRSARPGPGKAARTPAERS